MSNLCSYPGIPTAYVYTSLIGKFICDNYKQALAILATESHLKVAMAAQGINDASVFELWLNEEREYLKSLKKEPEDEVWQMDYYQMLVNLDDCE